MWGGGYTYDSVGTHKGLERELDSPGARVIDMSETPDTGAGNQTWVHTRAAWPISPALPPSFFFLK